MALEDCEDFLEKVEDVSRLIDGLASGKLSTDYIDKRTQELGLDEVEDKENQSDPRRIPTNEDAAGSGQCSNETEESEQREEELKKKVAELKAKREQQLRARVRFEDHMKSKPRVLGGVTDYAAWDYWTPEDELDEMFDNATPEGEGFKMMEKDINERHANMKRQRQISERYRIQGNEAYKGKQYAEALKLYETGIDLGEKTSVVLHSNAAMAALKIGSAATALYHCDKAMHISEFFLEDLTSTMVFKTLQRRGTARSLLGHFLEAVNDFEQARGIDKEDAPLQSQLSKARIDLEESRREKRLAKQRGDEEGIDHVGSKFPAELLQMEQAVQRLSCSSNDSTSEQLRAFDDIQTILSGEFEKTSSCREAASTYFRQCGGMERMIAYVTDPSVSVGATSGLPMLPKKLKLLHGALCTLEGSCRNTKNLEFICKDNPKVLARLLHLITHSDIDIGTASLSVLQAVASSEQRAKLNDHLLSKNSSEESGAAELIRALSSESPIAIRAGAASVISNCISTATRRKQVVDSLCTNNFFFSHLVDLIEHAAAFVQSPAISLLCNVACDETGRNRLAENPRIFSSLIKTLPASDEIHRLHHEKITNVLAVLGLFANCAIEERCRTLLSSSCTPIVTQYCHVSPIAIASRAILVLSRLGRERGVQDALVQGDGIFSITKRVLSIQDEDCSSEEGLRYIDSAIRLLALVSHASDDSAIACIDSSNGLLAMKNILYAGNSNDSVLGNASLALGNIAKDPAYLDKLAALDLIPGLVRIAHSHKGSTQKNSAIALARLAAHPSCLQQVKDLHAIEIIYHYVK